MHTGQRSLIHVRHSSALRRLLQLHSSKRRAKDRGLETLTEVGHRLGEYRGRISSVFILSDGAKLLGSFIFSLIMKGHVMDCFGKR